MKNGNIMKTIVIAGSILGLIGGVWAMDAHFLPREVHNLEMAAMSKAIQSIVKNSQIQRLQDEVYFWLRLEMQSREQAAKTPEDIVLINKLKDIIYKRVDAEQRLKALQCE